MKKHSHSLLVGVVTVLSAFFAGSAHATGPLSKLFLTAVSQNTNWVVQGSSVVTSWTQQSGNESPLAVVSTVRTIGDFSGLPGAEYTLTGSFTGTTYTNPLGPAAAVFDGTTDGTVNYSVDFGTGEVYSFNSDWTNPTVLFTAGAGNVGIAYDPTDNTLWLANFSSNTIEHRSLFGTLMSSFSLPFTAVTFLALDPADNTLWMGAQSTQGTFYQYSKAGTQLGTVTYPALVTQNTLGGEFQAVSAPDELEINGQGTFAGPGGKKASFAFLDIENEQVTNKFLEGLIAYQDRGSHESFQTGRITTVTASGNEAVIQGTIPAGGKHKPALNFTIQVLANQLPATNDTFSVSLSNGYSASGNLTSGFIGIRQGD